MVWSLCTVAVMERMKPSGGNRAGEVPHSDSSAQSARAWVERTCAAQGVPVALADVGAAREIAVLLSAGRKPVKLLDPPDCTDPAVVKAIPAPDGPTNDDPIEQHGSNGPLPSGSKIRPLAS